MKKLQKLSERGLALFIALVMCLRLVQVTAFAEDAGYAELTCGQEAHTHTGECYGTVETQNLICPLEEAAGHVHADGCFSEDGALICEIADAEGHTHEDACWQTTQTRGELLCTIEEHEHTEACYAAQEVPEPEVCVCATRCVGDAVNGACPVCGADPAACVGAEVREEVPAVVQAFLDAVAALPALEDIPAEATEAQIEALRAPIDACQEAYAALSPEDWAREDVAAAAETMYAVAAAFGAIRTLEETTGTTWDAETKTLTAIGSGTEPLTAEMLKSTIADYKKSIETVNIKGYTIESDLFKEAKLQTVTLENANVSGLSVFDSCPNLQSFTMTGGVLDAGEIFNNCPMLGHVILTNVTVDASAKDSAGTVRYPFYGGNIGTSVEGGLKVTITGGELGEQSMFSMYIAELELKDVTLKDNIHPFKGTYNNDGWKVIIEGGTIGKYAFLDCYLDELICKNTSIGDFAFYGYDAEIKQYTNYLKKLTIENVDSIGQQAFANVIYLTDITMTNVTIADSTYPFYGAGGYGQKALEVTATGGNLGQYAFRNCRMETLTLNNVDTVTQYLCYTCHNLKAVNGLANVSRIDGYAFYDCPLLAGLTVEDVTKMGFNGNYADVLVRVEAILKGQFRLDNTPEILELAVDSDKWDDSKVNKSSNWNTYQHGTQLMEQARWTNDVRTEAKVQVDAYYTAPEQMDFVFVADLSASMAQMGNAKDQNARFYDMQSKLMDVTDQLLQSGDFYDSRVAIVTFGGEQGSASGTVDYLSFTDQASTVTDYVKALKPYHENTDYGLGMAKALELVKGNVDRNVTVIFLSDGAPNKNGSGDQYGTVNAAEIRALGTKIFGVLHSPNEYNDAQRAMNAVCDEVFEATDTQSFGEAMNLAFTAVYPDYTVTIPVNQAFEHVRNLDISVQSGNAFYNEVSHTITWSIKSMPFTKHTLTYEMSLTKENADRYGPQSYPVNNGNAQLDNGGTSVETPVLSRTVAAPAPTYRYRIDHIYYTNGSASSDGGSTGGVRETSTLPTESLATTSDRILQYNGNTYTYTSVSMAVDASGVYVITLRYDRTTGTTPILPPPDPTPPTTIITPDPTPLGPSPDGVTIVDEDVPLAAPGLNSVDHYAYIIGYTDGLVHPEANITRAEVATIFFRLMTDEFRMEHWATENSFPDVKTGSWYNNGVSTSSKAGIVKGYEDGSFRPDRNITRAEFAAIAARFLSEETTITNSFSDISGHWAEEEINRAVQAGWIKGYTDGTFRPDQPITRAEAVTMINRMLDRTPDKDHLLEDMIRWADNTEDKWYYADMQEATNSHDYERMEMILIEDWTALLENRDWVQLEKEWSTAASAPGAEVADNLDLSGIGESANGEDA